VSERRLLALVGSVVFVDTMFYAVITPLLPTLAHQLHLSRLSAGLLTASYAAGTLVGSIPGGILAVRAGPRLTVCAGLTLLACSTVGFAWLRTIGWLDAARVVEGVGGACSWAGGLAWIAAGQPPQRRGAMIGRALAAAIGGSLLGPAIGALATVAGRQALFTALASVVIALIVLTRAMPAPTASAQAAGGTLRHALGRPRVVGAIWLMALPAIVSGMINVIGPLRLHRLGASAVAIGATFLIGAAIEAAISPAVGGLSDRHGRIAPLRAGLLVTTAALLCFTAPERAVLLAFVIVALASALGACWAPAMAMLADAGDALGLDQGLAAALMNLAWAGGQIVGAAGGGALAKLSGDGAPTIAAAALCGATALALTVGRSAPAPRPSRPR
jgi:MFS family permease